MNQHREALEAYFHFATHGDMGSGEQVDAAWAALRKASPLAYAAFDKGIGVLSVGGIDSTLDETHAVIRAYLALLEALCEVSPKVPWAEVLNGPSRVFTAYERSLADKHRPAPVTDSGVA